MKKYNLIYYISFLIFYLELISKILIFKDFTGLGYTAFFSLPFILIIYLLCRLFKEKGNRIFTIILTIILCAYYSFHNIFYNLFSNIFSFNTIGLATNIGEFKLNIIDAIIKNIPTIMLLFLPLIFLLAINKKLEYKHLSLKHFFITIFLIISTYLISLMTLNINSSNIYSAYNLYYNINSEIKTVQKFGVLTYTRLDIKRIIFGFNEKLQTKIEMPEKIIPAEEPKEEEKITYNELTIDFDSLIANESNKTIKEMLEYFKNTNPTNQNKYTGMFKDKNLIFLLAEGFNMIAVSEELTPTLYKLTHEGFVFNNFYSPVFLSTTGGEFQATTGLIPTQETLASWKKNKPTISFALGNSFSNLGYSTQSYHDWTYNYYNRDKTMPT